MRDGELTTNPLGPQAGIEVVCRKSWRNAAADARSMQNEQPSISVDYNKSPWLVEGGTLRQVTSAS